MLLLLLLLLLLLPSGFKRNSLTGPPEEADSQDDLFVLVRTDGGGVGYINMRCVQKANALRSTFHPPAACCAPVLRAA